MSKETDIKTVRHLKRIIGVVKIKRFDLGEDKSISLF